MSTGRRYERNHGGKLNIPKVIIALLLVALAIFGIYKLVTRKNSDKPTIKDNSLGREFSTGDSANNQKTEKTIDDYMNDYGAVLIEKVKEDTYYVSVNGSDRTLYASGDLADGKVPIWDGGVTEIKIEKDTKEISINTGNELKWIADQVISGSRNFNDITILLNSNIDLGGRVNKDGTIDGNRWNSIVGFLEQAEGSEEENLKGFAGTFDGNNHWIRGLVIESDNKYQGLFGYLNGTVKNLQIKDSYISGNECVGTIVGLNNGRVENCKIEKTIIKGKTEVGGFVGVNMTDSSIDRCVFEKADSNITGENNVGGIVGYLNNNSNVENCENRSNVTGQNYIGGIVGISFYGTNIINSSSLYSTIKGNEYVGGITGYSQSLIERCNNNSAVSGKKYIGGVAGVNYIMGNISLTYNSGDVKGEDDFIGGIAGINNATIVSTYNKGNVISSDLDKEVSIGGICGQNLTESAVNNSYNIGYISGKGSVGGVIGANYGMTSNCYYLNTSVGFKTKDAKTEEEMKAIVLDDDFKEDKNNINDGFKILNWQ